jgi:hypothetical protein
MYHPYFRGKQFELLAIRATAPLMSERGFVPIIEPVKESLGRLRAALGSICDADGEAIVIVNPAHGDLANDGDPITGMLQTEYLEELGLTAGILLNDRVDASDAIHLAESHNTHPVAFIHRNFRDPDELLHALDETEIDARHVFIERFCSRRYREQFERTGSVLIRDGFERRVNREHPEMERFSDLHLTYSDEGVEGFGDFLIVGDEYSESGGPAYAVAIHLTYIDARAGDVMNIRHFVSHRRDDPTDPAGKFLEALGAMITFLDSRESQIFESDAVGEFRRLYREEHFPSLGKVKELSMRHHIETFADYFDSSGGSS